MTRDDVSPIRLVLLDDHDAARGQSVARLSRHLALEVVADVADDAEALRLMKELMPDAVLVETPRLDKRGLAAIRLLSSLKETRRPAIISYLEILHRGDWPDVYAAGADDLLLKELSPDVLAAELRRIIGRVQRRSGTE